MKATKQEQGFASGVTFGVSVFSGIASDNTVITIICFAIAIFILIMQVITNETN